MNLSENFTLEEMLKSQTAERNGYKEQFTPEQEAIDNLKLLCEKILQPLREHIALPLTISSGYRCNRVNGNVAGASSTSQHPKGQAADVELVIDGVAHNIRLLQEFLKLGLEFDQVIIEYGESIEKPAWIHFSYSNSHNRNMILRATEVNGMPHYEPKTKEEILKLIAP